MLPTEAPWEVKLAVESTFPVPIAMLLVATRRSDLTRGQAPHS